MADSQPELLLKIGSPDDAAIIAEMVGELAEYERLAEMNCASEESIRKELSDPNGVLEVLIAWQGETAVGMATFFRTYSTFAAKRGIYLEDIFVKKAYRQQGIGTEIMKELARIAHKRDCGRMEWTTLLWNTPAIEFYERMNATPSDAWTSFRLVGESLDKLAADAALAAAEEDK